MLKVKIVPQHDGTYPETYFRCPHCNCVAKFYSVSPKTCWKCGKKLPNIRFMKDKEIYRAMYHYAGAGGP